MMAAVLGLTGGGGMNSVVIKYRRFRLPVLCRGSLVTVALSHALGTPRAAGRGCSNPFA